MKVRLFKSDFHCHISMTENGESIAFSINDKVVSTKVAKLVVTELESGREVSLAEFLKQNGAENGC